MERLDATDDGDESVATIEAEDRLSRDMREAAKKMGPQEIRYLVDGYYALQDYRKAAREQLRSAEKSGEPFRVLDWIFGQAKRLESSIRAALDRWSADKPVGAWMRSQVGIGPVISAGLLSALDISRAPTVGHFWSFAGLDTETKWYGREEARKIVGEVLASQTAKEAEAVELVAKHVRRKPANIIKAMMRLQKVAKAEELSWSEAEIARGLSVRPWNASLKVLCWKAGDCFVKNHNRPGCFYGTVYSSRKAQEVANNEAGKFASQAAATLAEKRITDKPTRQCYEAGKLPPGRIELRARRVAVRLFLSHLHTIMYWDAYGKLPPVPFSFTKAGGEHVHYMYPPNTDMFAGLELALTQQYGAR